MVLMTVQRMFSSWSAGSEFIVWRETLELEIPRVWLEELKEEGIMCLMYKELIIRNSSLKHTQIFIKILDPNVFVIRGKLHYITPLWDPVSLISVCLWFFPIIFVSPCFFSQLTVLSTNSVITVYHFKWCAKGQYLRSGPWTSDFPWE